MLLTDMFIPKTKPAASNRKITTTTMMASMKTTTFLIFIFITFTTFISIVHSNSIDYSATARERKISLTGRKRFLKNDYASSSSSSSSSSYPSSYRGPPSSSSSSSSSSRHSQPQGYSSSSSSYQQYQRTDPYNSYPRGHHGQGGGRRRTVRSEKPNIVVILTDDQDVLLGSLKYMPKLQNLLIKQGVYFNNSFVPTPMCCPSRSTFLTGMYVHNHNVYTNNANCSSTEWQKLHETRSFATYVNETYTTGYFGKYLNEYSGSHTPPGWHRWVGLIKNSRFYNYSVVDEKGVVTKHDDNYYADYLTDLVANDSRAFLHESKKNFPSKPVMMVLSVPAPHGPEDAAPQYQHMFENNTDHRTASWNYAPNPDKQWLLQNVGPMMPQHKIFTDLLQRRRLQTLQSVDDLVENVVKDLDMLGELDNTYILYTSDHGYHLGQFGLIKGKAMPYDFDTRVPLIVRGPGIRPGTIISNIVSNVDIAPTLIDMAGLTIPEHMDGDSMLRLIKAAKDPGHVDRRGFVDSKKPWRDTILLERGKLTEKALRQRMRAEEMMLSKDHEGMTYYIPPRKRKLQMECQKEENKLPCKPHQKWYCVEENSRLRKHKCRHSKSINVSGDVQMQRDQQHNGDRCLCRNKKNRKLNRGERRRQRRFLKRHVGRNFKPRFFRTRRSAQFGGSAVDLSGSSGAFSGLESMFTRRCRILANESVRCDLDIYQKPSEWESHKERIDDMIKEYRKALDDLRDIRRHLKEQRPFDEFDDFKDSEEDYDDDEDEFFDEDEDCDCEDEDGLEFGGRRHNADEHRINRIDNREERLEARARRRLLRKQRRRRKTQDTCNTENMNCFTHDNDHWKTPPYWTYGPFCFCSNANNNTYWCLRTINQTHDYLYCEFITMFMSYYDLKKDPFMLKNTVTELNYGILQQLHEELKKLKHCKGTKDCTLHSGERNRLPHDAEWAGLISLKRASQRQKKHRASQEHFLEDLNSDIDLDETNQELEFDYDYE